MNTPKLPPLPAVDLRDVGTREKDIQEFLAGYATAYAIAAIEAQGVPEGWSHAGHFYNLVMHALMDVGANHDGARFRLKEILKELESLASVPPAPQAVDNWRKYATEREDTAQAVIERHRGEIQSLLNLLAKDRKELAELKASAVQQEPVDFIVSVVVIKITPTGYNTQNKLYPVAAVSREEAHGKALNLAGADFPEHHLHTICSYPSQQAKPQP